MFHKSQARLINVHNKVRTILIVLKINRKIKQLKFIILIFKTIAASDFGLVGV